MIRRDKDVLTVKLPPKTVETCAVKPFSSELVIYEKYEGMFLKALQGTRTTNCLSPHTAIILFSSNSSVFVQRVLEHCRSRRRA
jgi:hypothetical protein